MADDGTPPATAPIVIGRPVETRERALARLDARRRHGTAFPLTDALLARSTRQPAPSLVDQALATYELLDAHVPPATALQIFPALGSALCYDLAKKRQPHERAAKIAKLREREDRSDLRLDPDALHPSMRHFAAVWNGYCDDLSLTQADIAEGTGASQSSLSRAAKILRDNPKKIVRLGTLAPRNDDGAITYGTEDTPIPLPATLPEHHTETRYLTRGERSVPYRWHDGVLIVDGHRRDPLPRTGFQRTVREFIVTHNNTYCIDPMMTIEDLATQVGATRAAVNTALSKVKKDIGSLHQIGRIGHRAHRPKATLPAAPAKEHADIDRQSFIRPSDGKRVFYYWKDEVLYESGTPRVKLPEEGFDPAIAPFVRYYNDTFCTDPTISRGMLADRYSLSRAGIRRVVIELHSDPSTVHKIGTLGGTGTEPRKHKGKLTPKRIRRQEQKRLLRERENRMAVLDALKRRGVKGATLETMNAAGMSAEGMLVFAGVDLTLDDVLAARKKTQAAASAPVPMARRAGPLTPEKAAFLRRMHAKVAGGEENGDILEVLGELKKRALPDALVDWLDNIGDFGPREVLAVLDTERPAAVPHSTAMALYAQGAKRTRFPEWQRQEEAKQSAPKKSTDAPAPVAAPEPTREEMMARFKTKGRTVKSITNADVTDYHDKIRRGELVVDNSAYRQRHARLRAQKAAHGG